MTEATLHPYRVSLHEDKGDKFTLFFDCYADDPDHAADQALDMYPNGEIVNVTMLPTEPCQHTILRQTSEVMMRWTWNRGDDGAYLPAPTHDKILHEETVDFSCAECGTVVFLLNGFLFEDTE